MSDGQQGDFVGWLRRCHESVSNLDANLETMMLCLQNIGEDITVLIGLLESRNLGLDQPGAGSDGGSSTGKEAS